MRRVKGTLAALAFLLALGLSGCNLLEPELADTGMVKKLEIEGGCWVIESNSETYLPAHLPMDLRIEDLRVQFEGTSRPHAASFCPGLQIDLIWIEAQPAVGAEG
ncbi:MAG: hypothetical protein HN396_00660 [Gemmatimonadales bacterium]|jgi:hypothetical protein|nr:hypothetical protein [Gemmatimonadales bacterium]MDG2239784.1 hypothetical protein [Longimicrobiales bacterium]NCG31554.1 hypothetical protein [Pseudomonadota bacterium]MBT3500488.1 hypothetical protein [Gemmatimonadales bacterium]MBT3774348.1 hypothetical protein [Gemmatimonadales bacterium]